MKPVDQTSDIELARTKYKRPSVEQLLEAMLHENATSFLVARNPMERLGIWVSSFKRLRFDNNNILNYVACQNSKRRICK
jgi:hypothetical protein